MKTNWQDPLSGEIISPDIAGLQEAVGKLEDALDMKVVNATNVSLEEIYISENDHYRIYQAPGKRNWVSSPAPVIKVNGTPVSTGFTINYGGGAVVFEPPLTVSDIVTADFSYVMSVSNTIETHETKLTNISNTIETHLADYAKLVDGKKLALVGGAIRNDGSGWKFIEDEGHTKTNLITCDVTSTINLTFKEPVKKIISFVAVADEALSKQGVLAGASVGLTQANITLTIEQPEIKGYITKVDGVFTKHYDKNIDSILWDSAKKELTINHADNDSYNYTAINRYTQFTPIIPTGAGAAESNRTILSFYDGNTYVDPPQAQLALIFSKASSRKTITNPNELVSPSGNLWITGIVELN